MRSVLILGSIALLSVLLASCELLTVPPAAAAHTLQLTVSSPPPTLVRSAPLIDHFVLTWFDEEFRYRRRIIPPAAVLADEVRLSSEPLPPRALLSVSIAQNTPTPITLTPVATNGTRFSPAGVVAPLLGKAGSGARHHLANLRWEEGCAVAPLLHAFSVTNGLHGFNFNRYLSLVAEQPTHEQCLMDGEAIVELLRRGTMRSRAIRPRPLHQTDLLLPTGHWLSSNLFHPPIVSDGKVRTSLPPLPYDIFHFFDPEQHAYLRISLTTQETTVIHDKNIQYTR